MLNPFRFSVLAEHHYMSGPREIGGLLSNVTLHLALQDWATRLHHITKFLGAARQGVVFLKHHVAMGAATRLGNEESLLIEGRAVTTFNF